MGLCSSRPIRGDTTHQPHVRLQPRGPVIQSRPHEAGTAQDTKSYFDIPEADSKKPRMVISSSGNIKDHYELEACSRLGARSHTLVSKAHHVLSGETREVKIVEKRRTKELQSVYKEMTILRKLDHPNIAKLYETFTDQRSVSLVLEHCPGGPLRDALGQAGRYSEVVAGMFAQQILRAVYYLHDSHKVCHRDLNLCNFRCCHKMNVARMDISTVKLSDFANAKTFKRGQEMTTKVGSPYYMSPQVLAGRYDEACDYWSCGVMIFELLCGHTPFLGESETEVLQKVKKGLWSFQSKDWQHVTQDAKQLITHLLKMDQCERYTAEQALNHVWIKDKAPKASDLSLHEGFIDHLRCFANTSKLKKVALSIIASQLTEDPLSSLRDTFMAFDANGDGVISVDEMSTAFLEGGIEDLPSDFVDILDKLDLHQSGATDYTEFVAAFLEKRHYLKESVCWKAFSVFDRGRTGYVGKEELRHVMNSGFLCDVVDEQAAEEFIEDVDKNGDGEIDFEEFMLMMLRDCSPRRHQ